MAKFEPAGDAFLRSTRYDHMGASAEEQGEPSPHYLTEADPNQARIALPDAADFVPPENNFYQLALNRRTHRRYDAAASLSIAELGYLLLLTQGLRETPQPQKVTRRYVPSAGSRHPFETYLAVQRVENLSAGIYHYLPETHALEVFRAGTEALAEAHAATFNQKQVLNSAVTFYWVAEVYRTSWRYGNRGYRYIDIDAGHVCQNLYLAAESIGCGVCAIAAFKDELTDAVFNLDGQERFTAYIASVGKKVTTA